VRDRAEQDPPGHPPTVARLTVHPASDLPDGPAWPDDDRARILDLLPTVYRQQLVS